MWFPSFQMISFSELTIIRPDVSLFGVRVRGGKMNKYVMTKTSMSVKMIVKNVFDRLDVFHFGIYFQNSSMQ